MYTFKQATLSMSIILITACTHNQETIYPNALIYSSNSYDEMQYYTKTYGSSNVSDYNYGEHSSVTVPDSYHVGATYAPTRAKDLDKNWVDKQNPQSYTILIAEDEKPAAVAKKLYQLPKNERQAEVKYQRDGKNYYQGVYGSYNNKEDAQKALNALPNEIKQQAGIKNWNSVQGNLSN